MKFKRLRVSGFARVNISLVPRELSENVDFAAAAADLINLIAIFYHALAEKRPLAHTEKKTKNGVCFARGRRVSPPAKKLSQGHLRIRILHFRNAFAALFSQLMTLEVSFTRRDK